MGCSTSEISGVITDVPVMVLTMMRYHLPLNPSFSCQKPFREDFSDCAGLLWWVPAMADQALNTIPNLSVWRLNWMNKFFCDDPSIEKKAPQLSRGGQQTRTRQGQIKCDGCMKREAQVFYKKSQVEEMKRGIGIGAWPQGLRHIQKRKKNANLDRWAVCLVFFFIFTC